MKRIPALFLPILLILSLLSCSENDSSPLPGLPDFTPPPDSAAHDAPPTPSVRDDLPPLPNDGIERRTVSVSTTRELIEALASDTEIRLAEGEYDISGMGFAMLLENLTLIGEGDVRLISSFDSEAVFYFADCRNIILYNLSIGHETDEHKGSAEGVLTFERGGGISIIGCELFGSKLTGIYCSADDLSVSNTVIRGCGTCAAQLYQVTAVFSGCSFIENCTEPDSESLFCLHSASLALDSCEFTDNAAREKYCAWDWDSSNPSSYEESLCTGSGNAWESEQNG